MAKVTLLNGGTGADHRGALNNMFTELYEKFVAATALADGYLTKEDWATFNGKQDALTDPVTLVVAVPASATDTGVKGQVAIDAEYIYLCTTPDTWVRAPLAFDTWGEG